jgi:DNA-binding protein HU-beta
MNAQTLVSAIAKKAGITKVAAKEVLGVITSEITLAVKKGDKVVLAGFGIFEKSARAARTGRNPQTGEEIRIPASKYPKFRPGKGFKEAVNRSR